MIEDRVSGQVLRHFNEMRFLRGLFARAGYAGLGIADHAVIQINQSGANQRRQRQNDGRGIASRIGYQCGFFQLSAMQLRDSVHRLRHDLIGQRRILVFEVVDRAVFRRLQPPRAAQVDHVNALGHGFRNPLARYFMRRSEEKHVYAFGLESLPAKQFTRISAIAADLGIKLVKLCRRAGFAVAGKEHWLIGTRVAGEKTRQFKTGVTGCSNNRGLDCLRHQARMSSRRVCSFFALLLSGVMIKTVSSPATVPTTSSQPSESTPTATGWAAPETVLITSRFWARRTSTTNSRTTRETAGVGSGPASPLGRVEPSAVRTSRSSLMSRESVACVT